MQGALVAYRVGLADYSTLVSALIISGYAMGMITAVSTMPYFIKSVGHVRVFAALTAAVSASMLLFPLLEHPLVWFILRFVIGLCYVGLHIVVEVWLNASVSNKFRGRVLSFYVTTQLLGFLAGQFLLRFTTPESADLFLVASIAISVAAIPLLMVKIPAPAKTENSKRMPFKELFKYSPFASLGTILVGMQVVPFYVALGFFAQKASLSLQELSILGMSVTLAGALAQYPVARMSDAVDRRNIIIICSLLAVGIAFVGLNVLALNNTNLLYVTMFCLAAVVMPIYAVNLSHANDLIPPEKFVNAGSSIQLLHAVGLALAPMVISGTMNVAGPSGYFYYIMVISGLIVIYALYRKFNRAVTFHRRFLKSSFVQLNSFMKTSFEDSTDEAESDANKNKSWDD